MGKIVINKKSMSAFKFIPVCEPTIGDLEKEYVGLAMDSHWISSNGSYLVNFEKLFPQKVGAKYGVAVSSGTAALHLAFLAAGIGAGDEVIIPSFTMISSANTVKYCGAKPVFVDSDPETWTIDPNQLEKVITKSTKAILTVSIYGHPSDYELISQFVKNHNLIWVEDAAEAHGALYKSTPLASFPLLTVYSFYGNKIITTGEGGMVCANDLNLINKIKSLRNLCFPANGKRKFFHEELGYNYRMTNLQAAIGCAQTERFDELVELRIKNSKIYKNYLKDISEFIQFPAEKSWSKNCYWMFSILLKGKNSNYRDKVTDILKNKYQIDSRPFFIPMHKQPIYETDQSLPVSEKISNEGLYLPSSGHLLESQIEYICDSFKKILRQN